MKAKERLLSLSHGTVAVLALFAVLGVALEAVRPGLGVDWVWVDLSWLPGAVREASLLAFGLTVLAWRWLPVRLRPAVRLLALALAAACLWDATGYYRLLLAGQIHAAVPLPLSLPTALALGAWTARPPRLEARRCSRPAALAGRVVAGGGLAAAMLLAQLLTFGSTDYRRPADAIVVLGARVYADGTPSQALADRVRTGVDLWRQGLAPVLVLSGGRDAGSRLSEPEAMAELAQSLGVPAEAIVLDESGVDSASTVATTAGMARQCGWRRVLVVSHDYHLSRLKLLCRRADLRGYTVPAYESVGMPGKPMFVARELLAWAYHLVRPLVR